MSSIRGKDKKKNETLGGERLKCRERHGETKGQYKKKRYGETIRGSEIGKDGGESKRGSKKGKDGGDTIRGSEIGKDGGDTIRGSEIGKDKKKK